MYLQMHLGKIMIAQCEIHYEGIHTYTERQQYQERIAFDLKQKHLGDINKSFLEPEFFVVGNESQLNQMTGFGRYSKMSDAEFIKDLEAEFENEFWSIIYNEKLRKKQKLQLC